jgi:hypothetical protein
MDFIVAQLKRNPKVAYADVKERASKKRLEIYPIMYGRAKALLGLVPVAARGESKSNKKNKITKRGPGRPRGATGRRPGRPPKISAPLAAVQDLVSNIEAHARENADLRDTLTKIRTMIDRIL